MSTYKYPSCTYLPSSSLLLSTSIFSIISLFRLSQIFPIGDDQFCWTVLDQTWPSWRYTIIPPHDSSDGFRLSNFYVPNSGHKPYPDIYLDHQIYLIAATSLGTVNTGQSHTRSPAVDTIFDLLNEYGVLWRN
jgi:hypothetical protein